MAPTPRIEAVARALLPVYGPVVHDSDVMGYSAPRVEAVATVAVAALDAYDREHAPASRDAKWIAHHDGHLREQIARDIEAEAWFHSAVVGETSDAPGTADPVQVGRDSGIQIAYRVAARIARGGAL